MIKKFDEFIFEEAKSSKEDNLALLLKLLNDKPTVKTSSKDEKGAYSLSGVKKYFRDNGKTNDQADDAFYLLNKDKSKNKLQSISAMDHKFGESIPHFFIGLSEKEASEIKSDYEKEGLDKNKDIILKKKEAKKVLTASKSKSTTVAKSAKKRSTVRKSDKNV